MHESVLLKEACENLHIRSGGKYIDATLGAGGHTREILRLGGEVLGLDTDQSMLEVATRNLKDKALNPACPSFKLINANFRNIDTVAHKEGFYPVDGILMDLGVSSLHFDDESRGFSFRYPDAELDMRLDQSLGVKAKDLSNSLPESELTKLFESRSIAKRIVERRKLKLFERVADFLEIFPDKKFGKTHPATKAFMDLRIAVNTELETIREALPRAVSLLNKSGRIVVITFHSGEDRVVKEVFGELAKSGGYALITKKPILPTKEETAKNPKSRSAKMRVLQKI